MDFLGNQTRMNFPKNRMGDGFSWESNGDCKKNKNSLIIFVFVFEFCLLHLIPNFIFSLTWMVRVASNSILV